MSDNISPIVQIHTTKRGKQIMTNYINTTCPHSNKERGTHYYLLIEGAGIHRAETVDDLNTLIYQTQYRKQAIKKAVCMVYGVPFDFVPETEKERFDREEGRERCKRIAEEIEAYADGAIYKCSECGFLVEIPATVGDKFKCSHCNEVNEVDYYEQMSIYDYFDGDVLDVEYRIGSDKSYRSVELCIGWGGPNIYIDTADAEIKLYWGTTREQYPIRYETRDQIDEYAKECWNCL